jgi:hypothetical protein
MSFKQPLHLHLHKAPMQMKKLNTSFSSFSFYLFGILVLPTFLPYFQIMSFIRLLTVSCTSLVAVIEQTLIWITHISVRDQTSS